MLLLQNKCNPNLCRHDLMDIRLSPLCVSATYEMTTIMKLLLKYGADPNFKIQDQDFELPLFIASENGNVQLVTLLLENSANPNLCSTSPGSPGWSPLYVACEKGHVEIVQDLLKHKADQNIYTKERKLPLHIAKSKGHKHIVCLLQQSKIKKH
ncbi:ANK [Mytilus coruscus]|uniref:ANK n=1 Tax=Mytilus coruscus TaxID=42192 RepID=A0A6J8AL88_MYTCO|nr:ANK [Mytilus coruscus]